MATKNRKEKQAAGIAPEVKAATAKKKPAAKAAAKPSAPTAKAAAAAPAFKGAPDVRTAQAVKPNEPTAKAAAAGPAVNAAPAVKPNEPTAKAAAAAPAIKSTPAARTAPAASAAQAKPSSKALPKATVRFGRDWAVQVEGALAACGKLTIEYDPARAQSQGATAWNVQAFALFAPGGEIVEAAAIEPGSSQAKPARTRPVSIEIPPRSNEVQIWFRIRTGAGQSGEQWDSNFGHNYRFQITA